MLTAIRERVGAEFIVGMRMAIDERIEGGIDMPIGLDLLHRLEADGLIDFVNVIRGNVADEVALTEVIPIHGMPSAPHLDFAGRVREATGLPVLHASKVDDVATARHAIREGKLDLVGMTRAHLADPHIVRKIIEGREAEIRPCVGATYCLDRIYEAGEALCIHNAATSREQTMPHVIERAPAPAPDRRRRRRAGRSRGRPRGGRAGPRRDACSRRCRGPADRSSSRRATRAGATCSASSSGGWPSSHRLGVDVRYDVLAEGADVVGPRARRRDRGHRRTAAAARTSTRAPTGW